MFKLTHPDSRVYQSPACDTLDFRGEGVLCVSGNPGEDYNNGDNIIDYPDRF